MKIVLSYTMLLTLNFLFNSFPGFVSLFWCCHYWLEFTGWKIATPPLTVRDQDQDAEIQEDDIDI